MKICTKIFGESGSSNSSNKIIAQKMNTQIEEWKEDSFEDEDKIINIESIDIIPNSNGIFATVKYTYSIVLKKELLIERMNFKEELKDKIDSEEGAFINNFRDITDLLRTHERNMNDGLFANLDDFTF